MVRFFDLFFSLVGIVILSPIFILLIILGYFDTTSPIFKQERIGKNMEMFKLFKFRTMYLNTKSVATHLVDSKSVTKYGAFLRRTKLDELPQLFNVLIGNMSLVGPRPNLLNQSELMIARKQLGVYKLRPGITGLAQIQKIDMSDPQRLAEVDAKMCSNFNLTLYFKCIFLTVFGAGSGDRVKYNR